MKKKAAIAKVTSSDSKSSRGEPRANTKVKPESTDSATEQLHLSTPTKRRSRSSKHPTRKLEALDTTINKPDGSNSVGKKKPPPDKPNQPKEEDSECNQLIKALNALNQTGVKQQEFLDTIKETRNNLLFLQETIQRLSDAVYRLSSEMVDVDIRLQEVESIAEIYVSKTQPEVAQLTKEVGQLVKDSSSLKSRVTRLETRKR